MKIKIGSKSIGDSSPTFTIAEVGINHNGSVNLAKKIIDKAVEANVDAVKFQTFKTEERDSPRSANFKLLKKLELDSSSFAELSDHAKSNRIIFFSTPFSNSTVDLLSKIDVPAFKISSGDLTDTHLLEYASAKQKPIIISTGMANLQEVREAVRAIRKQKNKKIIIMHSVSAYPIPLHEANLNAIRTLGAKFSCPIGFSDNGPDMTLPLYAVAVGAKLIEKHFTLSKKLDGPDHKISMNPREMSLLIKKIKELELILGDGIKRCQKSELKNRTSIRRCITMIKDARKGEKITLDNIDFLKPCTGIAPTFFSMVIGKKLSKNKKMFSPLKWRDINN